MTATEIQTTLKNAIARSRSHNEIVSVEIEGADISTVRAELNAIYDGEIDDSQENDGSYSVWGYTDDMADGEMDWRINVTLTAEPVTYTFWTDGGDQDDIEANSLEEAAEKASHKIRISEWNDGAWGIVKDPATGEQMDVPSRATETA